MTTREQALQEASANVVHYSWRVAEAKTPLARQGAEGALSFWETMVIFIPLLPSSDFDDEISVSNKV